ncbi:uncharacterized protein TNCV_1395131 [Trichonephila clavipes]|nr:uncharacterized protein TNCV_1395131 [Trichonephila clavipes]
MLPEPVRQVRLLYDRWRLHRFPPPQFRHETGREGNILQPPALVVSAATAHKTFGPTDLMSTYSVCTRRVFGGTGIEPRASGMESDPLTTKLHVDENALKAHIIDEFLEKEDIHTQYGIVLEVI